MSFVMTMFIASLTLSRIKDFNKIIDSGCTILDRFFYVQLVHFYMKSHLDNLITKLITNVSILLRNTKDIAIITKLLSGKGWSCLPHNTNE